MKKILIINGANLNLLGTREQSIYGNKTISDLEKLCAEKAKTYQHEIIFFQSNSEGEIINKIHEAYNSGINKLIINAGAYTHTSIAIMDCLLACNMNSIEVHISNIYKREDFRHKSYISKVVIGVICGLGLDGYLYAIETHCKN
jgi:3-dehydroquinate dehydratase-2